MKIPEGISLIDFTNEYKEKNNISNVEIASKTGISRTLVSCTSMMMRNYVSHALQKEL